jgi:hypothetical protein
MSAFQSLPEGRTLVEEKSFEESRDALVGIDVQRCDEMVHAITWGIARDPERYPLLPGSRLRLARAQPILDAPILRIFFTINADDSCSLWWIDFEDEPDETDETSDAQ